MKKKIVILGGYGIGMIAAFIAEKYYDYEVLGFLNDNLKGNIGKKKYKILGKLEKLNILLKKSDVFFFNAILDYKKKIKNKNFNIKIPRKKLISLMHPSCKFFKESVKFGNNILICSDVNISTDVKINDSVFIMSHAFIGHNTIVKKNSFIAASATIGGNVVIENNSFIGLNSTIIENCLIGKNSIVGAGSVVINNVNQNTIVKGNPAN
jgi:acetyltransferase EpsM